MPESTGMTPSNDDQAQAGERLPNPFYPGWRRYRDAEYDFRYFKQRAEAEITERIKTIPDFAALEAYAGFYADMGSEMTVQASFGSHLMGRKTLKGEMASERGASLVYSFGPTGWISVMLFPPESDLGRVIEDHIYLRIGKVSAAKLLDQLPGDLRDLVRYERVASLDTAPRIGERLSVAWLRYWSRMQVNGQTKAARSNEHLQTGVEFSTGKLAFALVTALLKPVAALIVVYLLIRFGMPDLVKYIAPVGLPQKP
ncbi:MAG: hypothetical protein ABI193_26250 [Minicystis sp.]